MNDLISIIIPVYKTEKYLVRCVESVVNQTYRHIEIILVDDGSPDKSPELCDNLSDKYRNIKVVHKENGGLSSSRNVGLDIASGNYISFIDSDDYIDQYMIERLYYAITKHNADVAMLQYKEVSCNPPLPSAKRVKEIVYTGSQINTAFLKLKIDSVCVGLYKSEVIKNKHFLIGKTSEDILFNFEVFGSINKFVYLPERRYYYYYNPESISNGPLDVKKFNYLNVREDIYEYYLKIGNEKNIRLAESLYARAAFGLLLRLALYGNTVDLNQNDCKTKLTKVFRAHKWAFYKESSIPLSRKVIACMLNYFFPIIRLVKK